MAGSVIKFVSGHRSQVQKLATKAFLPFKKLTLSFEVRWLCSTVRTLSNFCISYGAIILFLQKCSRNKNGYFEESVQERAKVLLTQICDPFFIRSVNALFDSLQVVSAELIVPFQSNRLTRV